MQKRSAGVLEYWHAESHHSITPLLHHSITPSLQYDQAVLGNLRPATRRAANPRAGRLTTERALKIPAQL
jgi:hypothetical protein